MSDDGTQHPLKIYYIMWIGLFVLSTFSYATDFMADGALRTFLILLFMFIKAGGIIWIFMHMGWERWALKIAILGPPVAILVLIGLMSLESNYIEGSRIENYGESTMEVVSPEHH
ncbi:MAG: cytochrome C oxidase subunit IV family protein [Woeseiaceae bacterium]|nr:cytochrome C oxidase subunit IV family protein [Woeseiaceae bacterium]